MAAESPEPIERWTAKRRIALVFTILKGETSVAEAARQHGLTVAEVEDRRESFYWGRKCPAESASGRRGPQSGADQKAETEDGRSGAGHRHLTGGVETLPFGPQDIRRVRAGLPGVSERRGCQVLGVSRRGLHRTAAAEGRRRRTDPRWTERLRQLIQCHPTFGYRRLWVLLRSRTASS
jgi:hypothetical protein